MTSVNLFVVGEPYTEWGSSQPIDAEETKPARRRWMQAILQHIALWMERSRSRRVLATLDDAMLRDIGLTRYEAAQEVNKPFWR